MKIFQKFYTAVFFLGGGGDYLQELVLSSHHVGPRIKLRSSGLATSKHLYPPTPTPESSCWSLVLCLSLSLFFLINSLEGYKVCVGFLFCCSGDLPTPHIPPACNYLVVHLKYCLFCCVALFVKDQLSTLL